MRITNELYRSHIGTLNALELSLVLKHLAESNLDKEEENLLHQSIEIATILHSRQTRKSRDDFERTPYIEHPLRNTIRLMNWNVFDIDVLVASMLHDVVEDSSSLYTEIVLDKTNVDEELARQFLLEDISITFGKNVERIVKDVTNDLAMHSSVNKNERYFEHVKDVISNNPETFLVKLSDFVDNATGLVHSKNSNFVRKNSLKYLPVVDLFSSELKNMLLRKTIKLSNSSVNDIQFKLEYTKRNLSKIIDEN